MQIRDIERIERQVGYEVDLRGFGKKTKEVYGYHIRCFLEYSGKHPRLITIADVKQYVVYLEIKGMRQGYINLAISAIKFMCFDIFKKHSFKKLRHVNKKEQASIAS